MGLGRRGCAPRRLRQPGDESWLSDGAAHSGGAGLVWGRRGEVCGRAKVDLALASACAEEGDRVTFDKESNNYMHKMKRLDGLHKIV